MNQDKVASHLGPLPHGWRLLRLKEITTKIGSGSTPKGGESVYLPVRQNFALIRSQNVYDRRFDCTDLVFISDNHAKELRGVALQSGDVLLNITGDGVTFSRCCIVPDDVLPACVNQHVAIIRPRTSLCLAEYLLSYLTHPATKSYIESFNAGGSRRAITKGHIESFLLPLPPLDEQEAIGQVLSAFDHKIELNRSLNGTLEAVIGTIFKSWFVNFDSFNEGRRWKSKPGALANLAILSKNSLNPADQPAEVFDHYSIPAFDEDKFPKEEVGGEIKSNKFWVPEGAVLLSKLNPRIPRVWMPWLTEKRRPICSTEFLVVLPRQQEEDREYLFSLFNSPAFVDEFSSRVTGTSGSHQRVRPDDLLSIECDIPEESGRKQFSALVRPIFKRMTNNLKESRSLAAIRDTLLPKLISGELRIKQAEKIVGEVT